MSVSSADDFATFVRADELWNKGRLTEARAAYRIGAMRGDASCQQMLAYFYDVGLGGARSRRTARKWYLRAWRQGDAAAAHNLGTIYRDIGNLRLARSWFARALAQGNGGSAIEMAKLARRSNPSRCRELLRHAKRTKSLSEFEEQEIRDLLTSLPPARR